MRSDEEALDLRGDMSRPALVVVSGLPGVGKSTVAKAPARRFERAAHVEADRLQELIVSGAVLPGRDGIRRETRHQLDLRLKHACGSTRPTSTLSRPSMRSLPI